MPTRFLLLIALLSALPLRAQAPGPALALTPPMGWSSWNHFADRVTDADVRAAADALVSTGMRDTGYVYVNIDDGWQGKRDRHGRLSGNDRFPDMPALAAYIHDRRLKLGIYSSPGPWTCAHYRGSYKHERQDAQTFAAWGVDYLKYDMCSYGNRLDGKYGKPSPANAAQRLAADQAVYRKMHDALLATGRSIVFSLCQYGWDQVWRWGASVGGNSWRTTGDIDDTYRRMAEIGFREAGLAQFAGRNANGGHWNDPDGLEVGNGGMTEDEYRTHLSLWALLAAPLIAGNDLARMTPATLRMLTDREVIAIDQDPLGRAGDRIAQEGLQDGLKDKTEIWSRPLSGGAVAVGLFNRTESPQSITLILSTVGAPSDAMVHDIWAGTDLSPANGAYTATVPAHGVALLRLLGNTTVP